MLLRQIICLLALSCISLAVRHKTKLRNKNKLRLKDDEKKDCKDAAEEGESEKLSSFSTLSQNWAKIFIYNPSNFILNQETLKFYQNKAYLEQQKRPHDALQEDNNGWVNIPSKDAFYLVLMDHKVYILGSRRDTLTKTVRILDCTQVTTSYKDENGELAGGVLPLGKFKEGYCLKANTVSGPNNEIWVFCFDTEIKRDDWLEALRICSDTLLLKEYEEQYNAEAVIGGSMGKWADYNWRQKKAYTQLGPDGQRIQTLISETDRPTDDGYWIIINDWSSCTVKCGGGTQTQQRQCVPPRKGGKACMGKEILTRPCNEGPCAGPDPTITKVLPLAVKTVQFSQRPWREERCIIKEGDLDIVRDDLDQFIQKPRVPSRVVLNNQTFTIFNSDSFTDVLFSVPLNELQVQNSYNETGCLFLIDKRTRQARTLCAMTELATDKMQNIDRWKQQILFFQNNCKRPLPIFKQTEEIIKIKQKQVKDEEEEESNKFSDTFANPKYTSMMGDVTNLAIDALTKEMKYEAFAEKEELERERAEQNKGRLQLEEVKDKMECLKRMNRQASQQGTLDIEKFAIEQQINNMKDQIRNMIQATRMKQMKKIKIMQKLAQRRNKDTNGAASEMKIKLAADLVKAYKKGDKTKCGPAIMADQTQIDAYCDKVYLDDPQQNLACKVKYYKIKVKDDFCFICCSAEFGSFRMNDRKDCDQQCGTKTIPTGSWVATSRR